MTGMPAFLLAQFVGTWQSDLLFWLGVPFAVLWLTGHRWPAVLMIPGAALGWMVHAWHLDRQPPEGLYGSVDTIRAADCARVERSAEPSLMFRGCRVLFSATAPALVGKTVDIRCRRCGHPDRQPVELEARGRLRPPEWLVDEGRYTVPAFWRLSRHAGHLSVNRVRVIREAAWPDPVIENASLIHAASVRALVLGDRSGLTPGQWRILADSGLMHLLVVSGLHMGGVLWLWVLVSEALRRKSGRPADCWRWGTLLIGTLLVISYAWLTGASIPAMRAAVMGIAGLLAWAFYRLRRPWLAWSVALSVVCAIEPGAPWMPGFWLSFGLVAALFLGFQGRLGRSGGWLFEMARAQLWLTLAGGAILATLFHQVPVMGWLANLIAIPLVVWFLFPLSVTGYVLSGVWPFAGLNLLGLADAGFSLFWRWAEWSASWKTFHIPLDAALLPWIVVLLLPLGISLSWRMLGLLCLALVVLRTGQTHPAVALDILDVGQGSAAVIRIGGQTWLVDSGTEWAARSVVAPWLRYQGVKVLNRVASHSDTDHSGGMPVLESEWLDGLRLAGQPETLPGDWTRCEAGQVLHREPGVLLDIVWPDDRLDPSAPDNAHSCVVRLKVGESQVLLTGDLERRWQYALLAPLAGTPTILVAPHHGAANGLNERFWSALGPSAVIISAGRYNRYGHPSQKVLQWLDAAGVSWFSTARTGQIHVEWRTPDAPATWCFASKS